MAKFFNFLQGLAATVGLVVAAWQGSLIWTIVAGVVLLDASIDRLGFTIRRN